jgi:hypothetical protein
VGLKQIIQNFSWDTLMGLPPSDFLALAIMAFVVLGLSLGLLGAIVSILDR